MQKELKFPTTIFMDQTLKELKENFNLSGGLAKRSLAKNYADGLFVPNKTPEMVNQIKLLAKKEGFSTQTGGRLIGINKGSDKGRATKILLELFKKEHGKIVSIGLGDSPNDFPMLKVVDKPFLVKKADNSYADTGKLVIGKAGAIGPEGWAKVVNKLI